MAKTELVTPESLAMHELEPAPVEVWRQFLDLTKIPRESGHEAAIRQHVIDFAKAHKFKYEVDSVGNILVMVPANPGLERKPGVVLQAHLDMICEGQPSPAKYGVHPIIEGKWLRAKNTTLGADDGIGVATAMAMAIEKMPHGPLALLFTVEEETAMTGAKKIGLKNKLEGFAALLNLDSEDEGEANHSCAGIIESIAWLPIRTEKLGQKIVVELSISGLPGGHSGVDIHEERPNSIKVATGLLAQLQKNHTSFQLIEISGGNKRNQIPSDARIRMAIEATDLLKLKNSINLAQEKISGLKIVCHEVKGAGMFICDVGSTAAIIDLLSALPHGVMRGVRERGKVQTSTNLGVVNLVEGKLKIEMSTRSSINEDMFAVFSRIKEIGMHHGATVAIDAERPPSMAWLTDLGSPLIGIVKKAWKELTKQELKVLAVHAGLECGELTKYYPHLSAISIGPTLKDVHTTRERVDIESVNRFYLFVKKIVTSYAQT